MDITEIEYRLLDLCQQQNLNQQESTFVDHVFANKILPVDYDGCEFILSASFYKNYDMVKLLIKNNANIHVDDNKPYRLALQNNDVKLMELLANK